MVSSAKIPSRKETLEKLEALAKGDITSEEASNWASPWIINGPYRSTDSIVWEALGSLCAADMKTDTTTYLYGQIDFTNWLTEFKNNCDLNPEK